MSAHYPAAVFSPGRRVPGRPPDIAGRLVIAHFSVRRVPTVEGRPWWPPVATKAWLEQALRCGTLAAADCTSEVIDCLRDGDDNYAGSVRVGHDVPDLIVKAAASFG